MAINILKTWEHAGMTCLLIRGLFNAPCGFVVLDETHPLWGYDEEDEHLSVIDVHGGITFSDEIPNYGWCIGFDMGHLAGDFSFTPSFDLRRFGKIFGVLAEDYNPSDFDGVRCIRTEAECIAETNKLAEQVKKIAE